MYVHVCTVYKIFSRAPVDESVLDALFSTTSSTLTDCTTTTSTTSKTSTTHGARVLYARAWLAYPRLSPLRDVQRTYIVSLVWPHAHTLSQGECGDFELSDGVFDLSAMECVISTMETQTVAARIVARLLRARIVAMNG